MFAASVSKEVKAADVFNEYTETPAGAAPELFGNGGGILLGDYTVESMVDAIMKIDALPESDWQYMSEQAYEFVKKYSWDDAAVLFEETLINYLKIAREQK